MIKVTSKKFQVTNLQSSNPETFNIHPSRCSKYSKAQQCQVVIDL